ncbi:11982_t:CDS:2, partial [Gigaspora margarita]
MLTVLAPFYEATKIALGVSYAVLNMVNCTMHYFKKTIALPNNNNYYYAELLYSKLDITVSQSSLTNIPSDNEIVKLAVCSEQALNISHGHVQKHKNTSVNSQQNYDSWFKKCQAIEPLAITTNILKQVKATIYPSKSVDKLSELYRIEQTIIIEELNDNLSNNLSKLSLTNKLSNVNQVNYSLLGLSDDLNKEKSNISNKVFRYLDLPKEAQE